MFVLDRSVVGSENRQQLEISSHSGLQSPMGSRPEKHAAPAPTLTRPKVGYKSQSRNQMVLTANKNKERRKQPASKDKL